MKNLFQALAIALVVMLGATVEANAQSASDNMKAFMKMLDGSEDAAEDAMDKYASEDVLENGMLPFGGSPTILDADGDCFTVRLTDEDDMENTYLFCWSNGKISSFDWADLEDEDEDD